MKRKFEICQKSVSNETGDVKFETIKSFRNEPEAQAFYNDWRNLRRYGSMYMFKKTEEGSSLWDDHRREWTPNEQ